MAEPSKKSDGLPTLEALLNGLDPVARQRVLLEAKIQILVEEAVATSAIEGVHIDPRAARRAVIRRLGIEAGMIPPGANDVNSKT